MEINPVVTNTQAPQKTKEKKVRKRTSMSINGLTLFIIGAVFVVLSFLTFQLVMKGVYGSFSLTKTIPSLEYVNNMFEKKYVEVAILNSKYTENRQPAGSTWLSDNIITWQRFLDNIKVEYDIIGDLDLEEGRHWKYSMLILPGSQALSDNELVAIKKFIDRGGSVFATGGTASYSADGKWRGWQFLTEIFGVKFIKDFKNEELQTHLHTLRGNLPLTANIPTGYPMKIATWDRPIAVEVLEPRTTQVSFWYNYRQDSGLVREEVRKSAGIINGTYGRGRFIWFGFELNAVIGVQEDFVVFDRLFQNGMAWLNYKNIGYIKDWPGNYEAAAIIVPQLTEEIDNINNLLPILGANGVRADFMIDPGLVSSRPDLVTRIMNYGNLGAIIDIGYLQFISDTSSKLDDYKTQSGRIEDVKKLKLGDQKSIFKGMIPTYGLFDDNTVTALVNNRFYYVMTDSLTDRSVPRTIIKGDRPIISITKTARDDFRVIRDLGLTEPEFQLYTYKEDVDRVLFEGGLYVFKLHTEHQCKAQYVQVVSELIKYMKSKNIWVTNAMDIYNWWVRKNKIEMRVDFRSNTRMAVTVSNPGYEYLNEFLVNINLQRPAKNIRITAEIIGTEIPNFTYDEQNKILYLSIKNLKPGKSRIYYIDYDVVKENLL
ncbi:MAG TPA: hypothetical protein PKY46_07145 [Ignavibacteriaceae bacterium]|nr:hypothetical protein [Ignavibacteriaceae bacterium]